MDISCVFNCSPAFCLQENDRLLQRRRTCDTSDAHGGDDPRLDGTGVHMDTVQKNDQSY